MRKGSGRIERVERGVGVNGWKWLFGKAIGRIEGRLGTGNSGSARGKRE